MIRRPTVSGIEVLVQNDYSSGRSGKNDREGCSHVIHNDRELEMCTNALFQLTALENPSSSQREAIELLTLLIERHEQALYAIPPADAVSVVRFPTQQQVLAQPDLIPQFGSESAGLCVSGRTPQAHDPAGPETKCAL
jgi:antitoxin component HigA of HigAB toxin-antitoxin module